MGKLTPYLNINRALREDKYDVIRQLLDAAFGDADVEIPVIMDNNTFNSFINSKKWKIEMLNNDFDWHARKKNERPTIHHYFEQPFCIDFPDGVERPQKLCWAVNKDEKNIYLNKAAEIHFVWRYGELKKVQS